MKKVDKTKLQTLKGFRDFLPEDMAIRNEAIRRLRDVFERFGFSELKTPALEYQEVLLGKYGEEAEKLMYLFKDPGERGVGLKYDLTVPLARVVANYPNLPKPFKRFQIQPVWRAESPQKARYREFYQCDVDIVGSSSPIADAEVLAVIDNSLKALGFDKYKIRVNSRPVLFKSMEKADIVENKWQTVIQSIDKLDKKSADEVKEELEEKGLSSKQIGSVFEEIEKAKPDEFLKEVIKYANSLGVKDNLEFDSTLARGLDYYTGPIFESVVGEPQIGSVTGGGRYDNLLKELGGPDLPATGTTVGLDRVAEVVKELDLWPDLPKTAASVLVCLFSDNLSEEAIKTASTLRDEGIKTELYPDPEEKLEKQLKYADKKAIPWVIIVGPEEKEKGKITLKEMETGEQSLMSVDEALEKIGAKQKLITP